MKQADAAEFQKNPAAYLETARGETVIVTEDSKPCWAVLPYEVFAQLRRGNRQALHVSELSEADMKSIADAKMDEEYDHLDEELDGNDTSKETR